MSIEKKNIVITSASRNAIGTFRGSLKNMQAHELGSFVAKDVLKKSNLQSDDIDELIMGQVLTGGAGQNPSRQASINIGLPVEKTAYVINQVCGSGLRSGIIKILSLAFLDTLVGINFLRKSIVLFCLS